MTNVDIDYIRRAVRYSDLAALRVAAYQASKDEELRAFGPVKTLTPEDKEALIEKLTNLLHEKIDSFTLNIPNDDELKDLMFVAFGQETNTPEDFAIRRELLSFKDWPFFKFWPEGMGKKDVPKDFSVAIIGGGFNGIATAVQLEQLGIPYTLYEKRHELGGTWSINKYPDIRVDTMSASYEFVFDIKHKWSEYFGRGAEVRQYLEDTTKKQGVWPHVRLEHALKEARFDETAGIWHLTFSKPDGTTVSSQANVIVSASGLFANPKKPQFKGQENFKGMVVHPTEWPVGMSLKGKKIAVLGNGSTGVQLLKPVAAEAEQVYVCQRTPQWMGARDKYGASMEPEIHWLNENMPGYWNWCRFTAIMHLFTYHQDYLIPDPEWQAKGGGISPMSDAVRDILITYIKNETNNRPELYERLIPDYAPMLRRPIVDNDWYKTLTRDNVELITDDIVGLGENTIKFADGTEREVDMVVTATGFDILKYLWPAEYIGRGGMNLHERWAEEDPRAYIGMMVPNFPNLFIMYGPNSQPVSGGVALPTWYQMWAGYVAMAAMHMFKHGHKTVEVTEKAFWDYNNLMDEEGRKLALVTDKNQVDRNYYINKDRMQVNCPWEVKDLFAMFNELKHDDLDFA
jgi:4-hydroxyacetophenone monooxygenase